MRESSRLGVLDLYCGLGGLSIGFEMTGAFHVLGGIDNDPAALETYRNVHPHSSTPLTEACDMSTLAVDWVLDQMGQAPDVIIGGPPCQGFSAAGRRLDSYRQDPRNRQVFEFQRFVFEMRPKAFLMENVSGIKTTGQSKKNELLDLLISEYEAAGYRVAWQVVNSARFRVPQRRKRMVMIGTREEAPVFGFPDAPTGGRSDLFRQPEPWVTVRDALSDLPTPIDEDPQPYRTEPQTPLQAFLRGEADVLHNHLVTNHNPETVQKLESQKVGTRLYDWNHSWYRLNPDEPSPTIKMNNRAPAVHHSEPRLISPRECARLQTIPDGVVLAGNKTQQLRQVGNAVPPILAAHLATAISEQVFGLTPPSPWSTSGSPLGSPRNASQEPV